MAAIDAKFVRGRQPNDLANQRKAGYIVTGVAQGSRDWSTSFGGGRIVQVGAGNAIRPVPARAGAIVNVTRR